MENINQEQREERKLESIHEVEYSMVTGFEESRIDAWCVVLVQQKAPEMKKRLAVAVCLEKNIVFVFVLSTRGYSMYLGRKTNRANKQQM